MVEQRNQADHGCGRYSKRSIVAGSIPAGSTICVGKQEVKAGGL